MNLLKKDIILKLVSYVCVLLSGVSCQKAIEGPYKTAMLGEFNIKKLDPVLLENYNLSTLLTQVCARLTIVDQNMKISKDIATSWVLSEDKSNYTFKIDTNRKFFDGSSVNADDVIYSLERAKLSKKLDWFDDVEKISKINNNTIKIELSQYNPRILYQLSTPRACILSKNKPFVNVGKYEVPNSGGAYKISEISKKLILEKNEFFPAEHVENKIEVSFMKHEDAIAAFKKGEVHDLSFYLLSNEELNEVGTKNQITSKIFWSWVLMLNPNSPNMATKRNRELFKKALDKEQILEQWGANIEVGSSVVPKGMVGNVSLPINSSQSASRLDCKEPLTGAIIQGVQKDKALKDIVVRNLKLKTNCTIELHILPMNEWSKDFRDKKYDFYISALDTNSTDPLGFYRYFIDGQQENTLGYKSKKLNEAFTEVYSKAIITRESNDYTKLAKILDDESFVYVFGYPEFTFVYSKDVKHAHMNPLGMHLNRWWEIGR